MIPWTVRSGMPGFVLLVMSSDRAAWFVSMARALNVAAQRRVAGKDKVSFSVNARHVKTLEDEAKRRARAAAMRKAVG